MANEKHAALNCFFRQQTCLSSERSKNARQWYDSCSLSGREPCLFRVGTRVFSGSGTVYRDHADAQHVGKNFPFVGILMTIYVVDDDPTTRNSLVSVLRGLGYPVRGCASAAVFRELYTPNIPGVLIVELQMSGETGLDLCQDLRQQGIKLPILCFSEDAEVSTIVAAMKAGAMEYLPKPVDCSKLAQYVEQAIAIGNQWHVQEKHFRYIDQQIRKLTRNDRETLHLILNGESNKRMAALLNITERAVELRRQRLMKRMGTRSLAELLDLAVTHRVLSQIRKQPLKDSDPSDHVIESFDA